MSHYHLQWLPSQRSLHCCLGKVPSITYAKAWQVSEVWKSLAHTISLRNRLHKLMAHLQLAHTNSLPFSTYTKCQLLCMDDDSCLLCVSVDACCVCFCAVGTCNCVWCGVVVVMVECVCVCVRVPMYNPPSHCGGCS